MPVKAYANAIRHNLEHGDATEHTHRPALKALLEALGDGVQAVNEPVHLTTVGAPDFLIRKDGVPAGHTECKDIGTDLRATLKTDQLKRYLRALPNLLVTDYVDFEWYVEGQRRDRASLGEVDHGKLTITNAGAAAVETLLHQYLAQTVPTIGTPKHLAELLAAQASLAKEAIHKTLEQETETGPLHGYLNDFRKQLLPDLKPEDFADMVAQTLAYGLFSAWVNMPTGQTFSRHMAASFLPGTNPFLQHVFHSMTGPGLPPGVAWAVDRIADILNHTNRANVMEGFGAGQLAEDPVIHFYETFLAAYDPKLREKRGVYYTPEPVVSYIVRSVDHLLKTRFNLPDGLADTSTIEVTETDPETGEQRTATYPKVLILDPACGTGTFLHYTIKHIHRHQVEKGEGGTWQDYVRTHLLPRLYGFELLMAPYTMAHMKLAHCLREETSYEFQGDERLNVFLTNALEPGKFRHEQLPGGFAHFIAEEAQAAAEVKREKPIMVVIGNPPYSVSSANKGEHIESLMETYKEGLRGERNIQPLSDDYIKFLRSAHERVERTGEGVVAMVTNHAWIYGLVHRGMRHQMLATFSDLRVLDLHGNARVALFRGEGAFDKNVFDIQQGVAICLLTKQKPAPVSADVYHAELLGSRDLKNSVLLSADVASTPWQPLAPEAPGFFFAPHDTEDQDEYRAYQPVEALFRISSVGIVTHRDALVFDLSAPALRERLRVLCDTARTDDSALASLGLHNTPTWDIHQARAEILADPHPEDCITRCTYRPFDVRHLAYHDALLDRPRRGTAANMLQPNIAIVLPRQVTRLPYANCFVSRVLTEFKLCSHDRNSCFFPLYIYPAEGSLDTERRPNLDPKLIAEWSGKLSLRFINDGRGDLAATFGPEDVFDYAYAVFHSPTYRSRYAEFLKIDFPRLPLTSDLGLFRELVRLGGELVRYHLLESVQPDPQLARFEVPGDNEVEKVRYDEAGQRVCISKTQHFAPVPKEVFEFHIGGYQVLDKWLKDRKGRKLTSDDVTHYRKTAVALRETIRLMAEVDEAVPEWPIS